MSTSVTPGPTAAAAAANPASRQPGAYPDGPSGAWPPGDGASGGGHGQGRNGSGDGARSRLGPLGIVLIGLLAVVMAGGWALVVGHAGNTPGIAAQTITFRIESDTSVQVRYAVAKAEGDVVRCTVDAFDTDFAIVAAKQITVPAGVSKISRTDTLRTSERATGARVKDCRKV